MQARHTDGTLGAPFLRCVQKSRKLIVINMLGVTFWYCVSLKLYILVSNFTVEDFYVQV
jgi:hypothetical protein